MIDVSSFFYNCRISNRTFIFLIVLLCSSSEAKVWSQVMSENMLSVRTIVENNGECPLAYIDGKEIKMNERASVESDAFPEKVCELLIPRNTQNVRIGSKKIPTLPTIIKKIVIVGDTGCRIGCSEQQACND